MKKSLEQKISENWPQSFEDFDFNLKGRPAKLEQEKKPNPTSKKSTGTPKK